MSVKAKDQNSGDLCKSHAARCDKDYFRVCPSKLSKRELEDLYYSLLENNLELKRAVNSQNEKIRNLSTKVQRMTTQNRTSLSREPKECCAAAKVAIAEQRASIADLKKANECMAERIRRLNMRLCSAKQFLKRSPNLCVSKCFNCISGASASVKNLSTSALHDKTDGIDNLRSAAVSAQSVNKKSSTTRTVETNTPDYYDINKMETEKVCDENKCRTTMEEFKQKIVDLQEELSKTHTEYSARMSLLEQQVSVLRASRTQALRAADDAELARNMRETSAAAELESKLKLERGKVAELEMRLKAADMSQQVAKTIENHLSNVFQLEEKQRASQNDSERCNICMSPRFTMKEVSHNQLPTTSKRLSQLTVPEDKNCKSEDSGYAEMNRDSGRDESMNSLNRQLTQRVAYLQAQLDALKSTADTHDQSSRSLQSKLVEFESYDVVIKEPDVPMIKNIKDYNCVIIDPSKKVIVEIDHVNDGTNEGTFNPAQNSPNEETDQVQNKQLPIMSEQHRDSMLSKQQSKFESQLNHKRSSLERRALEQSTSQKWDKVPSDEVEQVPASSEQHRDSMLSKQQSRFESQSNQKRSSIEQRVLEKTASQKSEKAPNVDEVSKKSSNESKINMYGISQENNIDNRFDNGQKSNVYKTEDVRMEEGDAILASYHTIYKNDTQDNISSAARDAAAENNLKKKVRCKCPKCREYQENVDVPGTGRLSDETGNYTEVCLLDDEPLKDETAPVNKPVSLQKIENELMQRDSQVSISARPIRDGTVTVAITPNNKPAKPKCERHNSLQIPGPLPTNERDLSASKINKANGKNGSLKVSKQKRKNRGISIEGICGNGPTSPTKEGKDAQNDQVGNMNGKTADNDSREAILNNMFGDPVNKIQYQNNEKKLSFEENVAEDFDKASCSRNVINSNGEALTGPVIFAGREEKIGVNAPDPTCFVAKLQAMASSASPGNTYNVVEPDPFKTRASTPDNTDNEISVMTDLPTERDGTTPRDVLSPGEDKATTTYTESYPVQDQMLSEGEVPNGNEYQKRKVSTSMGEYPGDKLSDDVNLYNQESSAQKMEAALQAISQELARCRSLLHSQRSREVTYGPSII